MKLPFKFTFKGKKIIVKEYTVCNTLFSRARGLMFRSKNYNRALLFPFDQVGKYEIHSFFCNKFIAVWLAKGKIIDIQLVEPYQISVTGKGKFDELLEIPQVSDE